MDRNVEDALELAAQSLARRDLSRKTLAEWLVRSGVEAGVAGRALDELTKAGYLDERRLAVSRATALAERHYGDEAIAARLASEGVEADEIAGALVALPSEDLRARRAMAAFTGSLHRRYAALRRRGFSQPAIEAALAELDDQDRPPLA